MNNHNDITQLLQSSSLKSLIEQNKDLDSILQHLKSEFPNLPSPKLIKKYIAEVLDIHWDSVTLKWINNNPQQISLLDRLPPEEKKDLEPIINSKKNKPDSKSNNDIKQSIDAINEKLTQIDKKINEIENHINFISNTPTNKHASLSIEDFTKIYADKKVKKSITLNTELKKKIDEYISKEYGIEDNDSLIINIALLIALKNI